MAEYVGKTYVIPDEHKAFVAEHQKLLSKYPKAANRYGLVDLGDHHARTRVYVIDCLEIMGITVCEAKEREQ